MTESWFIHTKQDSNSFGFYICCARTESQLLGFRQDSNGANQQVSVKRDFAEPSVSCNQETGEVTESWFM